jgi:hypothetical protein
MNQQPDDQRAAVRPPAEPERRPPVRFQPVAPERPAGPSMLGRLFLVLLLGVGGYGAFYGYCRYQASERERAFHQAIQDLHQALIRPGRRVEREDVRRVVLEVAARAGVSVNAADVEVTFEPLTPATQKKLASTVQMGLNLVAQLPGEKRELWVAGFRARLLSRHRVAKVWFDAERYTYLGPEWVGR